MGNERTTPARPVAYIHGFASGPGSRKGRMLASRLADAGLTLEIPDLNRPSFAEMTVTSALATVEELVASDPRPWCLVGSSLGGWIASLFAARQPARVDRLVLLCPAFDLVRRWQDRVGVHSVAEWRERGYLEVDDAAGRATQLRWRFYADAESHDPTPSPPCPTLVVHGERDDIVPLTTSRAWVARAPERRRLVVVDDGHDLLADPDCWVPELIEMVGGKRFGSSDGVGL